ncbi:MAG TPA: DUF4139 domain-containing protein [Sedimentisphaerales bacterium]|nr:DUF4139 domain-containing protein [Sedimentisphaerales bacterium]
MKVHLTERELIEYQFRLASEAEIAQAREHLEGCGECRDSLEQLNRRFAALDLLREDAEVSEQLISKAVERAGRPAATRTVWLRAPAWIGAAAAVLLMGSLVLISVLREATEPVGPVAREPMAAPAERPVTDDYRPDVSASKTMRVAEEKGLNELAGAHDRRGVIAKAGEGTAGAKGADVDFSKAPFAPASAIELVVLPRRENVQITIYNSADLTLVRERRNLTLKRGWNWLQFMWANTLIDPTSLHLEPLEQKEKVSIEQLVFPARLRELGRWLIRSEVGGQVPFEITYFTSGLSWRAFYMGTLSADERKMKLQGYVRVANNSGEDYENAQTRLIVGQVHLLDQIAELARRQYPYGSPIPLGPVDVSGSGVSAHWRFGDDKVPLLGDMPTDHAVFFGADRLQRKEIKKEGLSEYFLYTIEGTETIPDKWGKRLMSFEEDEIEVKSLYKYDEERYGQQTIRFVSFANDEEHNLGKTPIPNGDVKIYGLADSEGYLSYVGGTSTKYIPVNEEVELNLGAARLVTVEPKLMDFQTANYRFDRHKNIAGRDEIRTWKMEIMNTRTLPVEIEITRGFGTAYWSLKADIPYEKHDVSSARFKLEVEPRSKRTFNYTVTTYHGVREEAITE